MEVKLHLTFLARPRYCDREFTIYDALSKQRNLSSKTKALNNLRSQGYPPRLSHSQHNVKLSSITSFEQHESLLRRKRRYLKSKL